MNRGLGEAVPPAATAFSNEQPAGSANRSAPGPSLRGPQASYHTRTWLLWLLAAGLPALLTRNPLYLVLIILAARAVDEASIAFERAATPDSEDNRRLGWSGMLRFGLLLAGFSAGFNALAAHAGTTVLGRLPLEWPILGGALTAESLLYGALGGLAVVTILLVAATFNTCADTYALLRGVPAFLSQAGLITALGLAYVPQTVVRVGEIREAQVLRGHRFRGPAAMLPLAMPLLAGGLDRALQLAEAMEARGFSGYGLGAQTRDQGTVQLLLVLGTGAVAIGAFAALYFRGAPGGGAAVLLMGFAAVALALRRLGRLSHRTRYRHLLWRRRDTVVTIATCLSLALTVGCWLLRPGLFLYSPYPTIGWPPFEPIPGLALLLLAVPLVPLARRVAAPAAGLQWSEAPAC